MNLGYFKRKEVRNVPDMNDFHTFKSTSGGAVVAEALVAVGLLS